MKYYSKTFLLSFIKSGLILLFIVNLSSCKFISRIIWKVKPPQVESVESLNKFLRKKNYDVSKLLLFQDVNAFALFDKKYNMGVPEAYFINSSGEFVEYKKTSDECNAAVDDFILEIEGVNRIHPQNGKKLGDINNLLKTPIIQEDEIIILMTWAIYAGKINTTHSLGWIDLVEKAQSKGVKINYYLLNCDFLDTWGIDAKELKKSSKKNLKDAMKEGK